MEYDENGKPTDKSYLEQGLHSSLIEDIKWMQREWDLEDRGETDYEWDIAWDNLYASINSAEVNGNITSEQAWYLREKYLRYKKDW